MSRHTPLRTSPPNDNVDPRFGRALADLRGALDGLPPALNADIPDPLEPLPTGDWADLTQVRAVSRGLAAFARSLAERGPAAPPPESGAVDVAGLIRLVRCLRSVRAAAAAMTPLLRAQFLRLCLLRWAPEHAAGPDAVALAVLAVADAERQLVAAMTHLDGALAALRRATRAAFRQQDGRIHWTGAQW